MGRCGRLLAAQHYGVRADITVLAKALGGGLPLGAVLMSAEVAAGLAPGLHGTTFGGGPVAAAAGRFMLGQLSRPSLLARVRRRGRELRAGLDRLAAAHASLGAARGLGLLCAIELAPRSGVEPAALGAACREHGLLLTRGGEHAVRFLPPLNVSPEEIAEALQRFERAVRSLEITNSHAKGDVT